MDSDLEHEDNIPCWDNEDRQFFSEGNSSDDNEEVDDEMPLVESSVERLESSMQPGQVSLSNAQCKWGLQVMK